MNLIFYFSNKLEKPLYLKTYSEVKLYKNAFDEESGTYTGDEEVLNNSEEKNKLVYRMEPIEVISVKNSSDNEYQILRGELPEFNNLGLKVGDYGEFDGDYNFIDDETLMYRGGIEGKEFIKGNKYIERTKFILEMPLEDEKIKDELLLKPITKIKLVLSSKRTGNLKEELIDIGEVYATKDGEEQFINEYAMSGLNSECWNSSFYLGKGEELKAIEMKSMGVLRKNYFVYINGKEIDDVKFPLKVEDKESVEISIKSKEKNFERIKNQRINLIINDGKKDRVVSSRFTDLNDFNKLTLKDIKEIEKIQQ
ncbi:hypothetical protein [Clostridium massiliamazoniense]|uniref:hypothetical protein n=1 Tax=Clostridium massiliamazoniense TaxID=1347366 RepID=UPI001A9A42D0|nr:hypothetical protein [Clostridium massiliamazoniense]